MPRKPRRPRPPGAAPASPTLPGTPGSVTRDAPAPGGTTTPGIPLVSPPSGEPVFDIGFGLPMPDGLIEAAYSLDQDIERVTDQIMSALTREISIVGMGAAQCQQQIRDRIEDMVADFADAHDLAMRPLDSYVAGLTASAMEFASQAECIVEPALTAMQVQAACDDPQYLASHGEQCLTKPIPTPSTPAPSSPEPSGAMPPISSGGMRPGTTTIRPPLADGGTTPGGGGAYPSAQTSPITPGQVRPQPADQGADDLPQDRPEPPQAGMPPSDAAPSAAEICLTRGPDSQECRKAKGEACSCPKCAGPGQGADYGECYYDVRKPCAGLAGIPQSGSDDQDTIRQQEAYARDPMTGAAVASPLAGAGAIGLPAWRAYYDFARCECYVVDPSGSPRSQRDLLLAVGTGEGCVRAIADAICPPKPPEQDRPKAKPLPKVKHDPASGEYCASIDKVADSLAPHQPVGLGQMLGVLSDDGGPTTPAWATTICQTIPVVGPALCDAIAGAVRGFAGWVTQSVDIESCVSPGSQALFAGRIIAGALAQYVGSGAGELTLPVVYASRHLCPTALPSADQAVGLWLADQISEDVRNCWITSNNQLLDPYLKIAESRRSRFNPNEILALCRRGHIDESTARKMLRELGYVKDNDWDRVEQLSVQVPTPSDIIMLMMRDADDDSVVERFKLDSLFEEKFADQLKEWAKQQGLTEKHARYLWRAHWQIPPPTALYQFQHRLSRLPDGDPAKVTDVDIREALVQQDIAPYWIDKFLAIAHPPLGRIDIRRAYRVGAITRDDLPELYMQLGYTDESAAVLTEYTVRDARRSWRNLPATRRYASGEITEATLRDELQREGADAESTELAVQHARSQLVSSVRKRCLAAIRRRVLNGASGLDDAVNDAMAQGLDVDQATLLSRGWACERDSRDKTATVSQMTQWLDDGTLDAQTFFDRLRRLKYSQEDAVRIVRHAQRTMGEREQRRAEALAKQDEAAQRRQRAEQEREMRKAKREIDKLNKGLVAARKAKERRAAIMSAAAKILAARAGIGADEAAERLRASLGRIRADYGLRIDPGIKSVTLGVESWKPDQGRTVESAIDEFAFAEAGALESDALEP